MRFKQTILIGWMVAAASVASVQAAPPTTNDTLPALTIKGEDFIDAAGRPVKFWGVNLVACYPDHARADALAERLAALQVNLVRPHHDLRPSLDWNPTMLSGSLLRYKENSREFDADALDRFDYLNAALRRQGIYLALSVHGSRKYLPGDADILTTNEKDQEAWSGAVKELGALGWKQASEPWKMLPSLDERAALLDEEFIRKLLTHVNPYTGKSYASDAQVLTLEVRNEASFEYGVICNARFPDYLQSALVDKWNRFAATEGIAAGDLYKPADDRARDVRAKFLRGLDEAYFKRIKAVVRGTGCNASITYSNLWRGENALDMQAHLSGQIENHNYMDPLVCGAATDGIYELSRSAVAGMPFFVGELNQSEGDQNIRRQAPVRTMLPLAASAYGSLQNWSGLVWFAWIHGDAVLGVDGWAKDETRTANLGNMITDGMMIDHLRTAGMIFRRGLVARAKTQRNLSVDAPFFAANYKQLMAGKYQYQPGWQNVSEIRKVFGPISPEQANSPWMKQTPPNPMVSDTGEIVKDTARRQLTVSAPKAEAFSGFLDSKPPAGLRHLEFEGSGFATVELVSEGDQEIAGSDHLIISKTALDAANVETTGPRVRLRGLKVPSPDQRWYVTLTRPTAAAALLRDFQGSSGDQPLRVSNAGEVELPLADWHECELRLHK